MTAEPGHNSISKDQLRSIIERIENVEAEIKERGADRTDIYKEAAGNGYDVKALKAIVRIRKEDASKRAEAEAILATYMLAMGMTA